MSEQADNGDRKQEQLQHARRVNECIARNVSYRRAMYLALAIASILAGAGLLLVGQILLGTCGFGLTVVFGLLMLDSHSHLREVRHRPVGTLAPHISEFLRPASSGTSPGTAQKQV